MLLRRHKEKIALEASKVTEQQESETTKSKTTSKTSKKVKKSE